MLLKLTTPVPSSRLSLSRKLKNTIISIRGSSQTPTLRKKFSPHLNKSFNCYEEPSILPSYNRQSPSMLRDSLASKKTTKNRLRVVTKSSTISLFSQAKSEMTNKNYMKALDLLNKLLQEESNMDIQYYRGVCLMHLKMHTEAISDLKQVQEALPLYDPQLYIALYMCCVSINSFSEALRVLTAGIKQFPTFSKAYLLRGQLLNRMKKFDRALRDFKRTDDPEAQLHVAESLKGKMQYEKAVQQLQIACRVPELRIKALLEKGKLLYKIKNYSEACNDLEEVILSQENNYIAIYYRSKLYLNANDLASAGLLLEQVIQNSYDTSICTRALCKLALIKVKEKDFYGALHTLQRNFGKLQSRRKQSLYQYTEAVISLMKRKFSEGVSLLTSLIRENILTDYIRNCYVYRAYGYYAKGDYVLAIKDYKFSAALEQLDKASEFNYLMSQAVSLGEANDFKNAWKILKRVKGSFAKNPMPEICQICLLLNESQEDQRVLQKAEKIVEAAIKKRADSELLFIKALVLYLQGDFEKSYSTIKDGIDKAEENVACHYVMRAFSNVALKIYSEAVQDFSIALQLNENLLEIYPYRGVCAYLSEDYSLALEDLMFYSSLLTPAALVLAAKLLMFTACYSEALQVLDKGPDSDQFLTLKAYCLMMNFELDNCLELLENVKTINVSEDILYIRDIRDGNIETHNSGYLFSKKYALWMKGVALMYELRLTEAIDVFQDVLEIMHSTEGDLFNDNIIIEEENCEVLYNIALCNTMCIGEVRSI